MKKRASAKRSKGKPPAKSKAKPSAKSKAKPSRKAKSRPPGRGDDDVKGFAFSPLLTAPASRLTPPAIDVYSAPTLEFF